MGDQRAMPGRTESLQILIAAVQAAIDARIADVPAARPMADRIFAALRNPGEARGAPSPSRLPVCGHLERALAEGRAGPPPIPAVTDALAVVEPGLAWHRRIGSSGDPPPFHDGHANAMIVGEGGLEVRRDARIGVSLVAPGVAYPRHRHPPEEIYLVLSPGAWMQDDRAPVARRPGDLVHNVSNLWHGMRATDAPLLAIWCLWDGG
jgi:quercetin dioxygenase-like cupin family protein